jgi:hypothetical protein
MTTKNHDVPAFPGQYDHGRGEIESWIGINLRDYFAAQVLPAVIAQRGAGSSPIGIAQFVYVFADAMLEAREK